MALYHTYRPQTFEDIVGQEHIKQTLTNQISKDKVTHAYLFCGPRGVGKTTSARLIAKALNCTNREDGKAEPCNNCGSCNEITETRSIDVIEIDAASHTGVDNVRENIIENAQFQPTKSKKKIFIIDEVHMLSVSAFNALLKILEEPPSYVVFVLATTEKHKLLDTIVSRCQVFSFKRIPYDDMNEHLKKIIKDQSVKVDQDVIDRIINKSDGCARDAISLLDQLLASGEKHITAEKASIVLPNTNAEQTVQFVTFLLEKKAKDAIELLSGLGEAGVQMFDFSYEVIELLRFMLIMSFGSEVGGGIGADISKDVQKELEGLLQNHNAHEISRLIDLVMKRRTEIKSSPIDSLPLEIAVVGWCQQSVSKETKAHDDSDDNGSNQPLANIETTKEPKEETPEPLKRRGGIKEKVKQIVTKDAKFTLEEVQNIWQEFLSTIEKQSTSVTFILKMSKLLKVEGNTITICVDFDFHRDKLTEKEYHKLFQDTLTELLGSRARLAVDVQKIEEKKKADSELQELTSAFGGKVI
ncbi:MAG: DNA polymerase III subunit gamma/tau [Candidatus Magasanikbacteria bacterium]